MILLKLRIFMMCPHSSIAPLIEEFIKGKNVSPPQKKKRKRKVPFFSQVSENSPVSVT
jgi:hypothetical protein